jgi:hypothetical protein
MPDEKPAARTVMVSAPAIFAKKIRDVAAVTATPVKFSLKKRTYIALNGYEY